MNEDFSFVRFLKVVKTLYESSTFTQLGKTVGSALNPLAVPDSNKLETESRMGGKSRSKDVKNSKRSPNSESIFEALTDACNIAQKDTARDDTTLGNDELDAVARKDTLLEQVIKGCSMLASPADDDFSDEDTFKTRTEDESFYSEGESFETNTVDDYKSRRRSKRRH